MGTRERWLDSEMRVMVNFAYDFVKGRFDRQFRDVVDREKAKKTPCGNNFWTYLERAQRSNEWDLGDCNHSPSSCQTKWGKYLQKHLHELEGIPPEKVLFLYAHIGIKLSVEETQRIDRQYCGYQTIWRGGVLKDFKKKVNLRVETRRAENESDERRRRRERNNVTSHMNDLPSMEEEGQREKDGGEEEDGEGEGEGEEMDDQVMNPQSPPRRRGSGRGMIMERIQKDDERKLLTMKKKESPKKPEKKVVIKEEEEDTKPDEDFVQKIRDETINLVIPPCISTGKRVKEEVNDEHPMPNSGPTNRKKPRRRERSPSPVERKKEERRRKSRDGRERREEEERENRENAAVIPPASATSAASAARSMPLSPPSAAPSPNGRKKVSAEMMEDMWNEMNEERREEEKGEGKKKKEPSVSSNSNRRLSDGEVGDTVIYEQVPSRSDPRGEFQTMDESGEKNEGKETDAVTMKKTTETEGSEEEEVRRKTIGEIPKLKPRPSARFLLGRPSPAELVARLDRLLQHKRAAAAAVSIPFKQRSAAGHDALNRAVVDAQTEEEGEEGDGEEGENHPPVQQTKEGDKAEAAAIAIDDFPSSTTATVAVPPIPPLVPVETAGREEEKREQPRMEGETNGRKDGELEERPMSMWERLMERSRKKREELEKRGREKKEEGGSLVELLNPKSRLAALCENRCGGAIIVTENEEIPLDVMDDVFEGEKEERIQKRLKLANEVAEMNMQEDPVHKDVLKVHIFEELAVDKLQEAVKSALEDDSLWE